MTLFDAHERVHVVGVGGAGMSGVATLVAESGSAVSGCDVANSPTLTELSHRGVATAIGHSSGHVDQCEVVLWSPAISDDHPEIAAARARGVRAVSRSTLFGQLSKIAPLVGLCGTHGKTTATSMMVHVSLADGRDDGWLLGAPVLGVGSNGHWGRGDLIVEVDESFGTFREVEAAFLGVLNVEPDHLDYYGTVAQLESAFTDLIERTRGPVVVWGDDPGAVRVGDTSGHEIVTVAQVAKAPWRVSDVELARRHSSFTLTGPGESFRISLRVTGAHNVANAAVVATLARLRGIDAPVVATGLANFLGAPRRYQYRGAWRGIDVYEDYAHLPSEISVTIAATRAAGYQSVAVVFQPHRVTRTVALSDELARALTAADRVVVSDIYRAGEGNPTGVTGEVIVRALGRLGFGGRASYHERLDDVVPSLVSEIGGCDVLLFVGAGDVASVINSLPGGLE